MPFLKCDSYKISRSKLLEKPAHRQGFRHAVITPDVYKGEWEKSQKHGYGSMYTRSRRLYEGNWVRDFRHNFGISANGDKDNVCILEYRGNWRYGHYFGFGEKHYPDGGYYKGHFKYSKRCGYGQMWYQNGSFYDGDWCRDLKHGMGMYVYPNGNRFEGSWKKDKKHGKGRFFHIKTGQMQEGIWVEDICVTSFIEDIPHRQAAVLPTVFAIPKIGLENPMEVLKTEIEILIEHDRNNYHSEAGIEEKRLS